jgi:hypothetical protein
MSLLLHLGNEKEKKKGQPNQNRLLKRGANVRTLAQ